jgi:phenylacetic acid degradation operon negative regulatory protein
LSIEPMDDQLRRRSVGVPAARSLLLTVLGEYVLPRGDAVWHETLVRALVSLGYSQQAARQALSRSARDGWLTSARHGRRTRVCLSDRAAELLRTGAARIYSFGEPWAWDGRWLVLIVRVPEERREVRHQVRTRLAWAGLGSLGGGVWLTPHVEREAELAAVVHDEPAAETTSFIAKLGSLGSAAAVAAAGWDLAAVREHYETFIDQFRRVATASPQRCFRIQTLLVHAWRKFPFLDPDLPAELLASSWPRRRAHELFVRQHDTLAAPARAFFDELEARRSAEAA